MKKYYAIINPMQKGARDKDGLPFTDGYIHIFSSRKSRDEWVNEDAPDELGFYHRQGLYADVGTYQLIERNYITCVYHDEDEDDGYADAIEALLEGKTLDLPKQAPAAKRQEEQAAYEEGMQDFVICNDAFDAANSGSCAEEAHTTTHENRANKSGVREISDVPRKERRKNKKEARKEKEKAEKKKRKERKKNESFRERCAGYYHCTNPYQTGFEHIERLSDEWLELSEAQKTNENWQRAGELVASQNTKGYNPDVIPESRQRAFARMNSEDRWQEAQIHNKEVDESEYPLDGAIYNRTGEVPWWGHGALVGACLKDKQRSGFALTKKEYYGYMALGIFEYFLLANVIIFTAGIGGTIFLAIRATFRNR